MPLPSLDVMPLHNSTHPQHFSPFAQPSPWFVHMPRQLAGKTGGGAAVAQAQAAEVDKLRRQLEEANRDVAEAKAEQEREAGDLKELEATVALFEHKMEALKRENKELRRAGAEMKQLAADSEGRGKDGGSMGEAKREAEVKTLKDELRDAKREAARLQAEVMNGGGGVAADARREEEVEKMQAQMRVTANALEVEKQQVSQSLSK